MNSTEQAYLGDETLAGMLKKAGVRVDLSQIRGLLAGVLAAGNRAMIKPSEYTPATSELMAKMFAEVFSEEEIAVFPGGTSRKMNEPFSATPPLTYGAPSTQTFIA